MAHRLIAIALLVLAACQDCFAGYTVAVWPQVAPEYISVYRVGGQQLVHNPGTPPARPATFGAQICTARDIYSPDPLLRAEVWEDSAGSATSAELFAACPQIRERKAAEIRAAGGERLLALAAPYGDEERESWATQRQQADEWSRNSACTCTLIRTMAGQRGITVATLVGKIQENVVLFETGSGAILGTQQYLLDRISAESDFATLMAISWP